MTKKGIYRSFEFDLTGMVIWGILGADGQRSTYSGQRLVESRLKNCFGGNWTENECVVL